MENVEGGCHTLGTRTEPHALLMILKVERVVEGLNYGTGCSTHHPPPYSSTHRALQPTSPEVAVIEHVVVNEAGGVNHFRDLRQAGVL